MYLAFFLNYNNEALSDQYLILHFNYYYEKDISVAGSCLQFDFLDS